VLKTGCYNKKLRLITNYNDLIRDDADVNLPDDPAKTISSSYGLAAVDPPIVMFILERDFRIRWVSSAAARELKLEPKHLLGRSWYDLFPESRSRRALNEAMGRGERDAIDLPRMPLSLGCGTRYFSLRLRPLRAADGSVESILGLGEDVTPQVEAEQSLRESEARLNSALRGAQAAYWSTDFESGTTEISDNFFTMTGIDRARWDAAVEPWCTWVHSDDAPMGCTRYRAHLGGLTDFYEHEYRLLTPNGWLWLQDRGKIVERDSDGYPLRMAGTTTDISARKALEISIVDGLNQEQRRLSHDLHEGLAQQLSGTAMWLASVSNIIEQARPDLRNELSKIEGELRNAIEATQRLVRGLLPASIERGDVAPALQTLAAEMSNIGRLKVTCDIQEGGIYSLSPGAAQHIYAIAQQVLHNACDHPEVMTVALVLRADGDHLILTMSNETPVSTPARRGADTLCSQVMVYRAQALGGTLSEEQLPSGSKRIRLRCPARTSQSPRTVSLKHGVCGCVPPLNRTDPLVRRKQGLFGSQ